MTVAIADLGITSLFQLDATNVEQRRQFLTELWQEYEPSIDTKFGVLQQLVLLPSAMFHQAVLDLLEQWRNSTNLALLLTTAEDANDELVDQLAANYRITRSVGSAAAGTVTVIVSTLATTTIAAGSQFSAQGMVFETDDVFTARTTSAEVLLDTDRLLRARSDGSYAFDITVTATTSSAGGRLAKDTIVTPAFQPDGFVVAFAKEDFSGGYDDESNTALAARLQTGVTCQALAGRAHMSAALRAVEAFSRVVCDSVIGFGDVEMFRDQHTLLPTSLGGRADWYVRPQEQVQLTVLTKTATLVEIEGDNSSVWQFSLLRDEVPGFYEIRSVLPVDAVDVVGTFDVLSDTRGVDLSELDNDGFLPDIATPVEGAFSRFQTSTVRFRDTVTATAGLVGYSSTRPYAVTVCGFPLLAEIQDEFSSRSRRNYGGDLLVRAPIPCFLSVSATLSLLPGSETPDTDAIKNDLAAAVNNLGFTGRLPASRLADIIHTRLPEGAWCEGIDLLGRLLFPDGTFRLLRSSDVLQIPSVPEKLCTSRTVALLLSPADVTLSVQTADVTQV